MSLQNTLYEFAEMILSDNYSSDLIKPSRHLIIHKNNITAALVKALQETYPMVFKLIGEECFRMTAENYILQYPSTSSNMHDYGEYFSDFLAEYPPVHDLIYLPEVAEFEWICHALYFAAEQIPLDIQRLQSIPAGQLEKLHFALHPASRVIKFHYPILHIVDLCDGKTSESINLAEGGVNLLIIRRDLDIILVTLTSADYVFLNTLQDNHSLSIALKAAQRIEPEFNLQEKLLGWIKDKTLVDFSIQC